VISELQRIAIGLGDPCAELLSDRSCDGTTRPFQSCVRGFEHGHATLFADPAPLQRGAGTSPRFEGRLRITLADRVEGLVDGTARTCASPADVTLVREHAGLDAGVPPPDGAREEGDACLTSCAPGLLCAFDPEDRRGLGRCAPAPQAGEPCARGVDARVAPICAASSYCAEGMCLPTPRLGEPCAAGLGGAPPICGQAAYCDHDGLCHAHPGLGEPCSSDLHHAGATRDCALEPCCVQREGVCDAADDAGLGTCVEAGRELRSAERKPAGDAFWAGSD